MSEDTPTSRRRVPKMVVVVSGNATDCRWGCRRQQVVAQFRSRTVDRLKSRGPLAQIFFGVVEDLPCLVGMFERNRRVAGNYGSIVEQV